VRSYVGEEFRESRNNKADASTKRGNRVKDNSSGGARITKKLSKKRRDDSSSSSSSRSKSTQMAGESSLSSRQ
jgi:hypothetical protein